MRKLFFLLVFPYIIINFSYAQDKSFIFPLKLIKLPVTDSSIILPDRFVVENSEILSTKNGSIISKLSYKILYSNGVIHLKIPCDTISVLYQYLPLDLNNTYQKNTPFLLKDSIYTRKIVKSETPSFETAADIFGNSIKKSGSLIRSFNVGSNKDLSLNSGFRLQMNGNISDDISVTASLTDEATPLLPEGNTQTIKEVDKIFINIAHKNFDVTLGDFVFENSSGFLGNISRKLEGGKAEYKSNNFNLNVLYGSPPGKYTTNEFTAEDGVQGPYRLYSESGSPNILVIPGSEKIYLNGTYLKRGESEDYTIDYSTGEVIFTIKNLLKNNSRILIEFEYNDQQYQRSFLSIGSSGRIFDNIYTSFMFMQEGDNSESPVDFVMDEENKKIIKDAGNNDLYASKNSIQYVGKDSVTHKGLGQYQKKDTIIQGVSKYYYYYSPGSDDALYSIQFSFIGEGKGDYIRQAYGVYKWVGDNNGSYSAVNLLPLPERKRYAVWNINYLANTNFSIENEIAFSNYDRNTLSDIGGSGDNGLGLNTKINYAINTRDIFSKDFGIVKLTISNYYLSELFNSPNKSSEVDYYYKWNIKDSTSTKRNIFSSLVSYDPLKNINIKYEFAANNYGINNKARRNILACSFIDSTYPGAEFSISKISNDEISYSNDFISYLIKTYYIKNEFELRLNLMNEEKSIKMVYPDSLVEGYKIRSLESLLGYKIGKKSSIQYEFEYREDHLPFNSLLVQESERIINRLSFNYVNAQIFSMQLSGGFQKREFSQEFKNSSTGNNLNVFLKSLFRYSSEKKSVESNLFYESSSQYSAKNQKIYLRVEKGKGSHAYLGDLNNNGISDELEFQQVKYDGDYTPISVKTDELIPVTDIKTNFRIRICPSREIQRASNIFENIISNISSETNYQINEINNNKKNEDIYLLKLSKFLSDSNTIQGSQSFTQDIFFLEKMKILNIRFRYYNRKYLSQYTYGIEKRNLFERSLRFRFLFQNDITNETNLISSNDNSVSNGAEDRNYGIVTREISTLFSYRPINEMEISFGISAGKKDDEVNTNSADYNVQSISTNYAFLKNGNLFLSFERNEMIVANTAQSVPYNLTDGKILGISWIMNSNFNYQLNSFTTCSFNYLGRKPASGKILHNMTLEVKLLF